MVSQPPIHYRFTARAKIGSYFRDDIIVARALFVGQMHTPGIRLQVISSQVKSPPRPQTEQNIARMRFVVGFELILDFTFLNLQWHCFLFLPLETSIINKRRAAPTPIGLRNGVDWKFTARQFSDTSHATLNLTREACIEMPNDEPSNNSFQVPPSMSYFRRGAIANPITGGAAMKSGSRPMQVQPDFIRDHLKQYSIPAPASRSSEPR
jgi:hypothetical protein